MSLRPTAATAAADSVEVAAPFTGAISEFVSGLRFERSRQR